MRRLCHPTLHPNFHPTAPAAPLRRVPPPPRSPQTNGIKWDNQPGAYSWVLFVLCWIQLAGVPLALIAGFRAPRDRVGLQSALVQEEPLLPLAPKPKGILKPAHDELISIDGNATSIFDSCIPCRGPPRTPSAKDV